MKNLLYDIFASIIIFLSNCSAPVGLSVQKDIAYGSNSVHRADVYRQKDLSVQPIIVYVYGGGWRGGSKSRAAFVGSALARQGFVVVIPEYRHFPQVGLSEMLADHAAAVAWTLAHAAELGGDSRRVIIVGSSSGAWGAAMLALDPRWLNRVGSKPSDLAGMIGLAGPYMISSLTDQSDRNVFEGSGTDMEPIHYAVSCHPPMLLLTGAADNDVLPVSTVMLANRLHDTVGTIESRIYDGLSHADIVRSLVFPFNHQKHVMEDIVRFVRNLPKSQ